MLSGTFGRALLVGCLALALWACGATVTAPDTQAISAPRPVFLVEHGRHTSLVLTLDDDTMVRFAYGEWRWYAQNDTGILRALPVLLLPTQAALGRQVLPAPGRAATIEAHSRVGIDRIHALYAAAGCVDALIGQLEARFDAGRATLVHSDTYGLEFVHDPAPYRLSHNSNHVVAHWLRQLAFDVRGSPLLGRWHIAAP